MDEEKNTQQDGLTRQVGDKLKKGSKDMAKQAMKKVFKKVIMAIVSFILKFLLPMIIIAVLLASFWNWIEGVTSKSSDEANAFSVVYSSNVTDETNPNRIVVDANNISDNGAYSLNYEFEFKDEEGNPYTEEQIIEKIKEDLLEKNNDLDLTQFSNSELKIIGTLMYNGLMVEQFNEEELKAIVIFVKVDIATQSFDLRKSENVGQEVSLETLSNSDEVYGTIEAHRTKIKRNNDGNVTGYEEVILEYIPYGDNETQGTFCYMINQNDEEVINKFSIDEEGCLVFARWNKTTTEIQYLDEADNKLSDEDMEKIPEENLQEGINETNITEYQPIEYKQYITKYTTPYGLLSDLLIVTDNIEFCKELAQQALNGKIVINIKEELTTTTTDTTANYTQTTLLYDYVKYEVSGQKSNTSTSREVRLTGSNNPINESILSQTYGWDRNMEHTTEPRTNSVVYTYNWEYSGASYQLEWETGMSGGQGRHYWQLYEIFETTTQENLPTEGNSNTTEGDLINLDNKHITEEYDEYKIDEDYTADETFKYTIKTHTYSERNTYDFEISEVDGLYFKYKKQYNPPESNPPSTSENTSKDRGQYPEETTQILKTMDSTQINNDEHVTRFITAREGQYKQEHSGAKNVKCNVTELMVKSREKTASTTTYTSTSTTYKFGEEIADTTEIAYKNVELNGQPTFTATDENGEDEIGFLYIYDKYIKQGIDLYLENDAEQQLFSLLEKKTTTQNLSDVINYLLYVYDGIDRGVTELDLSIFKIKDLNKRSSTSLVDYIFNYIAYFEGGQQYVDGDCYIAINGHDGTLSDGRPLITIGHGVTNANPELADLQEGDRVPIEEVDAITKKLIMEYIEDIRSQIPDLTDYQMVAMVSFAYNGPASRDYIIEGYKELWDEERDNKYFKGITEEDISFLPRAQALIESRTGRVDADGCQHNENILSELKRLINTPLYTEYWGGYCHGSYNGNRIIYGGLLWRKYGEFMMFQYGYNIQDGTFFTGNSLSNWEGEVYISDLYTFPVYNQYDERWANTRYGKLYSDKTISSSGCGCCALAVILSGYLGEAITPDLLTDELDTIWTSGQYYSYNVGSNSNLWSNTTLEHFGCSSKTGVSWAEAIDALEQGYAVIGYETEHILAFVPTSSEDAEEGYVLRIIDSARGHNALCRGSADVSAIVQGNGGVYAIIYPPGH